MITVKIKVKNIPRCKHYLKIIENMESDFPEAHFLIIVNDKKKNPQCSDKTNIEDSAI